MYQFFETIKIKDNLLQNIEYHQIRVNRTLYNFFGNNYEINLKTIKLPIGLNESTIYKLKVIYSDKINEIEILPYIKRTIDRLFIINDNNIEYPFKYSDRTAFSNLTRNLKKNEEIIILKNGYLTDTSYTNIAFFDGRKWFSPSDFLLHGTKLNKLVCEGMVDLERINQRDLKKFKKCSLINAMLDLNDINIDVINIV